MGMETQQNPPEAEEELPAYLFAKPTKGRHRRTRSSMPDELNKIAFQSNNAPVKANPQEMLFESE
jgi:hypothetical protein